MLSSAMVIQGVLGHRGDRYPVGGRIHTPAESASQGSTRETGAERLHSQPLLPLNAVREQLAH